MRLVILSLLFCPVVLLAVDSPQNDLVKKEHPPRPEADGLRLEITAGLSHSIKTGPPANQWEWAGAFLDVSVALRNISSAPITLPTSAFDGQVDIRKWPGWGEGMERIRIDIEPPMFQGSPTVIPTARFNVVTLAPGECVLILHHHPMLTDRKHADAIKEASVGFTVSRKFAGLNNWWTGSLEAYQGISRHDDPDKEIARLETLDKAAATGAAPKSEPPKLPPKP